MNDDFYFSDCRREVAACNDRSEELGRALERISDNIEERLEAVVESIEQLKENLMRVRAESDVNPSSPLPPPVAGSKSTSNLSSHLSHWLYCIK